MNKAMTDKIRNKSKTILFVFFSILLVLATWYKLKIQGITMAEDVFYEEVLICDNTEESHVHSEECYEKVAVTSSDKQEKANQIKKDVQNTTDSNLEEQQVQNATVPNSEEQQDKNEQKHDLEKNNETNSQENTLEDMEQKEISEDTNSNNIMIGQNTFSLDATLARRCTITIISADGKISTKQVRQGGTYTLGSNLKWKIGDSSDFIAGGTQITVNEDITIEESKEITINYIVDTSTDATGLAETYKYDGIAIPTVQGTENIPQNGAIIFAGNHKHAFDPIMVMSNTNRIVHYMAKESLFKGIHGKIFESIGTIKVHRNKSNPVAILKAERVLKQGGAVGIFPEGTRNRTKQELLKFRYGAVKIAQKTNTPIIPFAIKGDYKPFRKGLSIEFGKPIDVSKMEIEEANNYIKNEVLNILRK